VVYSSGTLSEGGGEEVRRGGSGREEIGDEGKGRGEGRVGGGRKEGVVKGEKGG